MVRLHGSRIFEGIAIGKIRIFRKSHPPVHRVHIDDAEAEVRRFHAAREAVRADLRALYDRTLQRMDDELADIFDVQQVVLDDPDFVRPVEEIIETELVQAEAAVSETGKQLMNRFSSFENAYMQARAQDVFDVSERVLSRLSGIPEESIPDTEDTILLADTFSPGDCVRLDNTGVRGIAMRRGSVQSHTAILAGAMELPSLTGIDFEDSFDGHTAVLDGQEGVLIIDPDERTVREYQEKKAAESVRRISLFSLMGEANTTADGTSIDLFANIGGVNDVKAALKYDAGGIGLFRSEFLYLSARDYPTEEEQLAAYRTVASRMHPKKVVIRTLDIGADKRVDYFKLAPEHNPALGYRAIRICLDRPDILRTQLRAILRASAYGNIAVMYPMIASVWEVRELKDLFADVCAELKEENIPVAEKVEQGIMIETPAAVLISEQLAQEVDFFSIGTNDLTQYLLASDRQNEHLERYYDPRHAAVLRAIRMTCESAHRYGIRVGICGELAADATLTEYFLRLGIDSLSMSPSRILAIRDTIRKTDLRL